MRNLKRVLSMALALVMVLGMMVITTNAAYTDADEITYEEAIAVMTGVGVYEGYDDGSLKPTEILTREQAATIITRIMLGDIAETLKPTQQIFTDVATTRWSAAAIEYCYNIDMIDGLGDGTFDPTGKLTGTAFAKMLLVALGYDAAAEGYVGKDWKKNINADALTENLYVEDVTITDDCTREVAAQMVLQVLDQNTVKYVTAYDYATGANTVTGPWDQVTLFRQKYFPGLLKTTEGNDGVWGRPYDYSWTYGKATLWTEWEEAAAIYTAPVTECDVASALKLKADDELATYTNGIKNVGKEVVEPLGTLKYLNVQGRTMEVYEDEIVYIDTYLAEVTDVKAATFDAAGHLKTSSSMTLKVWTAANTTESVTLYGGATNYTYTKFTKLLVNAVDAATGYIAVKAGTYGTTAETLKIVGTPTAITGTQTVLWYNVKQHTVNGVTYNDSHTFYLNQAGQEIGSHTWYFDSYGNLIGAEDIKDQYAYGVITSMWWSGNATTGTGAAIANITYMDGTTAQVKIAAVDLDGVAGTNATKVYTPVYDAGYTFVNNQVVYAGQAMTAASNYLYVSSNAYTNLVADPNGIIADNLFQFVTLADGSVAAYLVTNESKTATIKTGYSLVDGDTDFYTNSDTVYLVRTEVAPTTYTYTSVSDYNTIGNFTGVTADWVNTDQDMYAEYVYFYGTADDGAAEFVFSNGNNYSAILKSRADGVYYYEFTYGVGTNGTTAVIPVADIDANNDGVCDVIYALTTGVGQLFKVNYTNGLATSVVAVDADGEVVYTTTAKYLGNRVTANSNVLYVNGVGAYNITTSTVVIGGTLADLAEEGKGVYVVYNTAASNYVTHIYITNYGPSADAGLTSVSVKGVAAALQLDGTYAVTVTAAQASVTTTEFVKPVVATGASITKVEYSNNAGTTWNNWAAYAQKSDVSSNPHLTGGKFQVRITVKAANGTTAQYIVKVTYDNKVVAGIAQVAQTKVAFGSVAADNSNAIKLMGKGMYMFENLPTLDPTIKAGAAANEVLFFVYSGAGAGDNVQLTISDKDGVAVYRESFVDGSGKTGFFYVQYTGEEIAADGNTSKWIGTAGLTTGSYTWNIVDETTGVLVSGTITIA